MLAHYLRKSVRCRVGVVRLKRDQRGYADRKVVEVELRYILRKSGSGIGDNSLGSSAGDETERGKRRLPTRRLVQVGRGSEKGQTRLIHRGSSDTLSVTDDELLRPRWCRRRKAGNACLGQGAIDRRIVEVVVERPVPRLAIVEVDPLSDLVVSNSVPSAVVRIESERRINVRGRDVGEGSLSCGRPSRLRDNTPREYALCRRCTAGETVLFP